MSETRVWGHALPASDPALQRQSLPPATPQTRLVLCRGADGVLEVQDRAHPANRPLRCHWQDAEMQRRKAAGRRQPLGRACALNKLTHPRIIDATAGLGRDALCLASLGAQVYLFERHALLQALLADAIEHLPPDLQPRMQLMAADARQAPWPDAEVIFLDPMFPAQGKRAAPGLDMQLMQAIVGPDEDAQTLLDRALQASVRRVVLKRPPRGARVRLGKPDLSFAGGRVSYEVYLRP